MVFYAVSSKFRFGEELEAIKAQMSVSEKKWLQFSDRNDRETAFQLVISKAREL